MSDATWLTKHVGPKTGERPQANRHGSWVGSGSVNGRVASLDIGLIEVYMLFFESIRAPAAG